MYCSGFDWSRVACGLGLLYGGLCHRCESLLDFCMVGPLMAG